MFGKLLKYDFRSMFKQFAFIWPAALAVALVNHFTINSFVTSTSDVRQTISGVAVLVYFAILITMFIIALIFTIQRFFKGLLGDEGYLMHTLPVKPWQLIASKLLCAVVTTVISIIVAILSMFLFAPWDAEDFRQLFHGFGYLFSHWDMEVTRMLLSLLELLLLFLVSMAVGYLQLYLSMSIGHLFNKNRVAMSVIAFIAINALVSMLLSALPAWNFDFDPFENLAGMTQFQAAIGIAILVELVHAAVYFLGTEFILRKKLNLE